MRVDRKKVRKVKVGVCSGNERLLRHRVLACVKEAQQLNNSAGTQNAWQTQGNVPGGRNGSRTQIRAVVVPRSGSGVAKIRPSGLRQPSLAKLLEDALPWH